MLTVTSSLTWMSGEPSNGQIRPSDPRRSNREITTGNNRIDRRSHRACWVSTTRHPCGAAPAVTVKGEIQCINNASPVGVWVEAEKSTSGWASTKVPIKAGGHAKVAYTYTLNKCGRYKVHVGCGGSSKKWGMTLKSGYLSGSTNNLACNDVNPALQAAWGKIPRKALGAIAPKLDLAKGVKYQTCGKV